MSQEGLPENTISCISIPEVNEPIINPETELLSSPLSVRLSRHQRRDSSTVKMLTEDYNLPSTDLPSRRASSPEKRSLRNSVIRLLEQQEFSRRFSAPEKTRSRRSSSIVKTLSEEHEEIELSSRRSSRSGSITKMTSEDNFADDECSRRSSRAEFTDFDRRRSSVRRGSSVTRMLSEEQHEADKSSPEKSESYRKSIDNGYKHSLESISEHKPNQLYPSLDSSTLDCLSDFAQSFSDSLKEEKSSASSNYINFLETVNNEYFGTPRSDSDNRSGEWNFFWKNYSTSANQTSGAFRCPSNSIENLSDVSNDTIHKDGLERVVFTLDEVNEALHCTERVTDILKDALKRYEDGETKIAATKEEMVQETKEESKNLPKPPATNCIESFLSHTGVTDILKKVLNKRREVLMSADESRRSSFSGWGSADSSKK